MGWHPCRRTASAGQVKRIARRCRSVYALSRHGQPRREHQLRQFGAEVVLEVRDNTPENAVVPVRGLFKGALEYVPPLLWPRLCCRVEALAAGASEHLGRPVAPYVIVSDGASLLLERR